MRLAALFLALMAPPVAFAEPACVWWPTGRLVCWEVGPDGTITITGGDGHRIVLRGPVIVETPAPEGECEDELPGECE